MEVMALAKMADKWSRRVAIATDEFADGVKFPKRDWEAATLNAVERWETAIRQAIADKLYAAGVSKSGTAKWLKRTLEVGVQRWPVGVAMAKDEYRAGFAPYHDALVSIVLPPRYARGDTRNYARVQAVGVALRKMKLSLAS